MRDNPMHVQAFNDDPDRRVAALARMFEVVQWVSRWSRYDLKTAHWHLGPVAVDLHLQGKGIGGALLGQFSTQMDVEQSMAYLETDRTENVTFYERFGFEVMAEDEILGVTSWFMSRRARNDAGLYP